MAAKESFPGAGFLLFSLIFCPFSVCITVWCNLRPLSFWKASPQISHLKSRWPWPCFCFMCISNTYFCKVDQYKPWFWSHFLHVNKKTLKWFQKKSDSEGAGGMAGMATAIPILVDLCSKAPPGTNFVFSDCPTNILLPAPPWLIDSLYCLLLVKTLHTTS